MSSFNKPSFKKWHFYWCKYTRGNYAHGRNDFIAKMQIALKECYETEYWITLLLESKIINDNQILENCLELKRMLIATLRTAKENK